MPSDAIVFAGLMPHAPVLIPGVGGPRAAQVHQTVAAMHQLARALLELHPDSIVVVSPHSPRRPGAFGLWTVSRLRGSFEGLGAQTGPLDLPSDLTLAEQLREQAALHGLPTWRITHGPLDHGALVPLLFLQHAGWHGPTLVVGLSDPGAIDLDRFGQAIAAAAQARQRRLALIASGDMSHRLTLDAPCGFHPSGSTFDAAFLQALRSGAPDAITALDSELMEDAAEDVIDPTRVALAATAYSATGREVLSYEGPFGVGYAVAVLSDPPAAKASVATGEAPDTVLTQAAALPRLARRAVETAFAGDEEPCACIGSGALAAPRGVFVTIRSDDGDLRGCRGSATAGDVVQQTWQHARSAAFHDSRFAPLRIDDLPHVRFSVSVLGELETVDSPAELDPARYGVLVSAIDGRGALLLPRIEGITSVADQMRCVKQKAAIPPDEWVKIERFTAEEFEEA